MDFLNIKIYFSFSILFSCIIITVEVQNVRMRLNYCHIARFVFCGETTKTA